MLSAFANSFKIPELRDRILFTLGLIFAVRITAVVPVPGVDYNALREVIAEVQRQAGGGFLGLYDLFTGGAMDRCAVGALGIMPYISASIILQLMTAVIPALERLAREGEAGRQKLTQYTRYLTVGLCVVQGSALAGALLNPSALGIHRPIVHMQSHFGFVALAVLTMMTGTMVQMWLGEQITARGIGNGISLIITINIVSRLPGAVAQTMRMFEPVGGERPYTPFHLALMLLMIFLVIAGTIAVTQAQRKIPVQYAKRVVGRKVYGGQSTYMPLRVNYAGVMPIIFAQSLLLFPPRLLKALPWTWAKDLGASIDYGSGAHMVLYALMILFFSYFWVATQFNPVRIADDLKKYGGYVPGIRPGTPTAEYLDHTMTRITLAGAVFLTVIAVIPTVMQKHLGIPWLVASFFGGTSLLIVVGVMLDTMRQIEAHLLTRHYDGFLKKGRLRGRT
ncbi:MAG: preprotein translocase subunit SecY [Kiritimatiellae bacterium]|nr:preprotein translocase subunit SecY [Kiritimatiellia bacterium]